MQDTQTEATETVRQYGRNDVDYETWYSDWMKQLARDYTRVELEARLYGARTEAKRSAKAHCRAIEATTGMQSQSARRANARNVTAAAGDTAIALRGALEIHDLFPERVGGCDYCRNPLFAGRRCKSCGKVHWRDDEPHNA